MWKKESNAPARTPHEAAARSPLQRKPPPCGSKFDDLRSADLACAVDADAADDDADESTMPGSWPPRKR